MSHLNRPVTSEEAARVRQRALHHIDTGLVVRESACTIVERDDQTFIALYTAGANGADPRGVLISLAGAASLVEDLTTLLNSSPAILAFIRETLGDRRREREGAASPAPAHWTDRPLPPCPVELAPGATCVVCGRTESGDAR